MFKLKRFELLEFWKRYNIDGLNSLDKLKYTIKSIKFDYLFTNVTIDIGPSTKEKIDVNKVAHSQFKFN